MHDYFNRLWRTLEEVWISFFNPIWVFCLVLYEISDFFPVYEHMRLTEP